MFVDPREMVDEWDVRPGMKVADFGCGSGHYSVELAKRIGRDGRVYAFDVQEEAISGLKSRMASEHLYNIEFRRADLDREKSTGLTENLLDMVLVSNILFQLEKKEAVAKEAFRVLRPGGRAIVIDWDGSLTNLGPAAAHRVKKSEAQDIFVNAGFKPEKEIDAEQFHYGLIFRK